MAVGCDNAGTPRHSFSKRKKGGQNPRSCGTTILRLWSSIHTTADSMAWSKVSLRPSERCASSAVIGSLQLILRLLSVVRQSSALGFVGRIFGRTHVVLRTTGWKWGIGWGPSPNNPNDRGQRRGSRPLSPLPSCTLGKTEEFPEPVTLRAHC